MLLLNGVTYIQVYPGGRFDPGLVIHERYRSAGYNDADFDTAPERLLYRYLRVGVYRDRPSMVTISIPIAFAALPMLLLLKRRVPSSVADAQSSVTGDR